MMQTSKEKLQHLDRLIKGNVAGAIPTLFQAN